MAQPEFEYATQQKGAVGARTILEVYGPKLEQGIERALTALFIAPPELGALLDARAKLQVHHALLQQLNRLIVEEISPVDAMEVLTNLDPEGGYSNGG